MTILRTAVTSRGGLGVVACPAGEDVRAGRRNVADDPPRCESLSEGFWSGEDLRLPDHLLSRSYLGRSRSCTLSRLRRPVRSASRVVVGTAHVKSLVCLT